MNGNPAEQAKTGLSTTIGRLCRHDVVFVPAVFVALMGTVDAVSRPPAWVKRLPVAVSDLASGERDNLNEQLSKAESSATSGRSTIEEQRARLAELTDRTSRLQAEISRQTATRQAADELVRQQQAGIATLTAERDRLAEELEAGSSTATATRRLENKLDEAVREGNAQRKSIVELEDRIVSLRRELGEQHAAVRTARSEIALQTARLTQATTERDALAKSLRAANGILATKVPQLERELTGTASRLATAESTLISRNQAVDQQGTEIRRLESRLQSAEARREALASAVLSSRTRLDKDSSAIAELERRVRSGAATLSNRDTEISRLSGSLRRAQAKGDELTRSSEVMRTRLAETSASLATAEQSLLSQARRIEAGKTENARLAETLKTTRAEHDAATETVGGLEKQASKTSERLAANETELQRVTATLERVRGARDKLAAESDAIRTRMASSAAAVAEFNRNLEARSAELVTQKAETARLTAALRSAEARQEQQASSFQNERADSQVQVTEMRNQLAGMTSKLSASEAQLAKGVEQRNELQTNLAKSQSNLAAQASNIARLTRRTEAAQAEVMRLLTVLGASDKKSRGLQSKLAAAAAAAGPASGANFDDLMKFRSEFFGRLSSVLGDRDEIRVVGDRFVFQAEVLFDSGSAELGRVGRDQLTKVAASLKDISRTSPRSLSWILRVDGHTDRIPIQTSAFPSNWELSAARAISVVRFLIAEGVPADRLSANGFGEHQPLDGAKDHRAYRRNRRIELKLTER